MRGSLPGIALVLTTAGFLCLPVFADDSAHVDTARVVDAAADEQTPPPKAPEATTPKPATPSLPPIQIKVSDTVNFRFGALLQSQADFQQTSTGGYAENVFVRRARFIVSGQVAKQVFF